MADAQTLVPGKLFIGGLAQGTTDETLRAALTAHSLCVPVDCHVMMDSKTGRSRGFGFAVFASPAEARRVVQLQPVAVDGRAVSVSECWEKGAAPSTRTEPAPSVASSLPPGGDRSQMKIFVGGLSQFTTKDSLDSYFAQFGYADSYVMMDKASGRSRGFGFVNFHEEQALANVLQMSHEIDGVPVTVSLYESGAGARSGGERALAAPQLGGMERALLMQAPPAMQTLPAPTPSAAPVMASRDQLKIFVGGLSQHSTKQSLDEYFSQFGQADSFIMTDRATGRSRGFGFVNFADRTVMENVLSCVHEIDGVGVTTSPYAGNANRGGGGAAEAPGPGAGFGPAGGLAPAAAAPRPAAAALADGTSALTASLLAQAAAPGASSSLTASLLSEVEEKLLGAVQSAAGQQHVQQQSDQQQPQRSTGQLKIFVGGLSQSTTKESLDAYFSQFGHSNSYVMLDKASGRSRGFGFVNFVDEQVMRTVLSFQHEVDGQVVTCNQYEDKLGTSGRQPVPRGSSTGAGGGAGGSGAAAASAGPSTSASLGNSAVEILNNTIQMISKLRGQLETQVAAPRQPALQDFGMQSAPRMESAKLFVGGLGPSTTTELLQQSFAVYGCSDAEVITDKYTGRSRGFGFVHFSSPEVAEAAMQVPHVIDGRQVELSECWEKGASTARKTGGPGRSAPY